MRAVVCTVATFLLLSSIPTLAAPAGSTPSRTASPTMTNGKRLSDAQLKRIMIKESIADYPGNCPCPYNSASNGSSCGGRSAWSRAGGASPLCYPSDISSDMLAEYRESHPVE